MVMLTLCRRRPTTSRANCIACGPACAQQAALSQVMHAALRDGDGAVRVAELAPGILSAAEEATRRRGCGPAAREHSVRRAAVSTGRSVARREAMVRNCAYRSICAIAI